MGADLYIPKLRASIMPERQKVFDEAVKRRDLLLETMRMERPEVTEAQEAVNAAYERLHDVGYFRDSYNNSSVLWRLGLSWWSDLKPDIERSEGSDYDELFVNCSPELCSAFLAKVEAAELRPVPKKGEPRFEVDSEGENSAAEWNEYFAKKRAKLEEFLKQAIDNGGMYASC